MIQRRGILSGLVQGVGFRAATFRQAQRYSSLRGYVRNLPDGRVEAVFAGEEDAVLAMVAWCRIGPAQARVIEMAVKEEPLSNHLHDFEIQDENYTQ